MNIKTIIAQWRATRKANCSSELVAQINTSGAATQGATPILPEIIDDLFQSSTSVTSTVSPLFIFPWKNCRSFLLVTITFPRVSPLECHPAPFLPVRPRLLTVLCKFSHTNNFSSGVTPYRVSPGAVPLSLMTPLLLIDRQTDMLRQIFSQIANQTIL